MVSALSSTAIVVVNYRSSRLLRQNLGPVAGWVDAPMVVVVDNHSDAEEASGVEALARAHGWTAVLSPDNAGFGGGANRGVSAAIAAGARTIAVVNPDAAISREDLLRVVQRCQEHPWALYSPRVLKADGSPWFDGAVVDLDSGRTMSQRRATALAVPRTLPWISGAVLVTSAGLWRELGGFDEDYFLYWEDVDLSARALRAGADLTVVQEAVAVHDEGGTQVAGGVDRTAAWTRSEAYYYYNIRNRLLFAARNLRPEQVDAWSASAWRSAYQTLLIGGRRKFLRPAMPLRAWYQGVRDGRDLIAAERRRAAGADRSRVA